MSRSGALQSPIESITVGDFDPLSDRAIEYDFIGRKIAGRYTVHAQIGQGGMADVFQATDEELGVDVAIKLLKPRMASDDLRARMVQEARAAAQVRHPNLVRVFGTGSLDGTAFIVMELLAGPNLEQYVRERPGQRLPCAEALALLLPALAAVHAVHERGYVHRDIKPGNILVTREPGRPPTAVVIDLGLVKPDRALRTADSPPTTAVGRMLCTPGYTSPEQALGRAVDRRSDVYSMAITLYRVLAGRLPFHEVHGKHAAALLARHIYNEPTQLVDAARTADIAPAVAAVVESALQKDPARRPQTMLEFADALRAAAGTDPVAPPHRPPRLNRVLVGIGIGVAATWLVTPRSECASGTGPQEARGLPLAATVAPGSITPEAPGPRSSISRSPDPEPPPSISPAPGPEPPPSMSPSPPPESPCAEDRAGNPRQPTPPRRPGSTARDLARQRLVARHASDVQRCADRAFSAAERIPVRLTVDSTGHVSGSVIDAEATPLSRCIDSALQPSTLPPGAAGSFVHTFTVKAAPRP